MCAYVVYVCACGRRALGNVQVLECMRVCVHVHVHAYSDMYVVTCCTCTMYIARGDVDVLQRM